MYRDKEIKEVLYEIHDEIPLVDLRSPGEYKEATIPGAYNVPLLDNVERSLVGKTHKLEGSVKARELAMEIISPRLPQFVKAFKNIALCNKVTIFCWRGGERSHFAGCILDAMGFKVNRIKGGFKAYRRHVIQYLNRELPHKAIVVHGLTGVGKTDLLLELERLGFPVLNLEGLANHRGSVFGKIGLPPSPGQKMFESLIEEKLRKAEGRGYFLVECESKKIGNLFVPESVIKAMLDGYRILAYAPFYVRIQRIKRDYFACSADNRGIFKEAMTRLTKYLGKKRVSELNDRLDRGDLEYVIRFLLNGYYDPLYKYPDGPDSSYDYSVNTQNITEAARLVGDWICNLPGIKCRGGDVFDNR